MAMPLQMFRLFNRFWSGHPTISIVCFVSGQRTHPLIQSHSVNIYVYLLYVPRSISSDAVSFRQSAALLYQACERDLLHYFSTTQYPGLDEWVKTPHVGDHLTTRSYLIYEAVPPTRGGTTGKESCLTCEFDTWCV